MLLSGALALLLAAGSGALLLGTGALQALAATLNLTLDIEGYNTAAPIDGQDGWNSDGAAGGGCGTYDHHFEAVPGPIQSLAPGFGNKALRISNAVFTGCFTDQTFTKPLANDAGETVADSGAMTGGVRSAYFEHEWQIISAVPNAQQPSLYMSVSPDAGDGSRMSYIRVEDNAGGFDFFFDDVQPGTDSFNDTKIVSSASRNAVHTIKTTMLFVDGLDNDIVRVYFDGNLVATGTSWESFHKVAFGAPTHPVDSVLYRTGGATNGTTPGVQGFGFYIDNIKLTSGLKNVFVQQDGSDTNCDGTAAAADTASHVCAVKTIARGLQLAAQSADSSDPVVVNVGPGTYSENTVTLPNKNTLTLKGTSPSNRPLITNGMQLGTQTDLTLENLMIEGLGFAGGAPVQETTVRATSVTNFTMNNVKIDGKNVANRHGMTGVYAGNITITNSQFENIAFWVAFDTSGGGSGTVIGSGKFNNNTVTNTRGHLNFRAAPGFPATSIEVKDNTWTGTGNFDNGATANVKVFNAVTATLTGNTFTGTGTDNGAPADFSTELGGGSNFYGTAIMPRNVTNLFIQNNLFQSGNQAIAFEPPSLSPTTARTSVGTSTITNNTFLDMKYGIYIPSVIAAGSNLTNFSVSQNSFNSNVANAEAVHNGSPANGTIPAETNWWGASSGPQHSTNAGATGLVVTNGVDFSPFLGHGTDKQPAVFGFQPDLDTYTTRHVRLDGSDTGCDGTNDAAFSAGALGFCAVASGQKGADLAPTGGTVQVAAGTYNGDVSITKPLTFKGANVGIDARTGAATRSAESILNGTTTTVTIGADNVVVDGFTIKGAGTGVVFSGPKSNTQLLNTIVTDNVIGAYPSCLATCTIQKNLFDSNNRSPGAAAAGAGIYTDFATTGLTITQNEFKNHNINSSVIFASSAPGTHHNVTFTSNLVQSSTPPDSAVYLIDVGTGTFSGNKIVQTNGTAISLAGGNSNITVENNDFTGSMKGLRVEKDFANFLSGPPVPDNSTATVHLNAFVGNTQYGLNLVNGYVGTLDASRNWWGNANGPTNAANTTIGGTGTAVMGSPVDFSPWLGDGTDTSANIGFQPNLSPTFALATDGINVAPTSGLNTSENGGTAQFAVVLASAPTNTVTVPLSSSNTNEGTVNPASLTFTVANWNVPQTVTVTGVALAPGNGNVAYNVITAPATSADPNFNGLNAADVSLTNNTAVVPAISIADASLTEGNSGFTQMTFNVTLSQPSPTSVSVSYATQDQTASSAPSGDFVAAAGSLTFAPGETAKTIAVQIVGDVKLEPNETFAVNLSNPSGGTIGRGQAFGTIQEDDIVGQACAPRPDITVQTQSIGGRQMQVTVKADTATPNGANALTTIQFKAPTNATIQMTGQATIGTGAITLPAGTRQIVFTVKQTDATAAFHVPFTVTDGCGGVEKFVGGGANALGN